MRNKFADTVYEIGLKNKNISLNLVTWDHGNMMDKMIVGKIMKILIMCIHIQIKS